MIEGIHFDFTGKELKDHFLKRAERNKMRAEAFIKELAKQKDEDDVPVQSIDAEAMYSNKAVSSARETMKNRVKHYKMRALYFSVGAEHLVQTETYRLSEHDLTALEIVYEG